MFSLRGYHGTSMQHIADELGIRKASLYHHVEAKEDLLFAIHEALIDDLIDQTVRVLATSASPEDKLRGIIVVNTMIVGNDVEAVTVFQKERDAVAGERWAALVSKRDLFERMVTGVIQDGIDRGVFADRGAALLTKAILAMPGWTATWFRPDGPQTAAEIAELYADLAIHGIAAPG